MKEKLSPVESVCKCTWQSIWDLRMYDIVVQQRCQQRRQVWNAFKLVISLMPSINQRGCYSRSNARDLGECPVDKAWWKKVGVNLACNNSLSSMILTVSQVNSEKVYCSCAWRKIDSRSRICTWFPEILGDKMWSCICLNHIQINWLNEDWWLDGAVNWLILVMSECAE